MVEAYFAGDLSLDELHAWLVDITWDKPSAPQLAHDAEHVIAEATTLPEVRSNLDAELAQLVGDAAALPTRIST